MATTYERDATPEEVWRMQNNIERAGQLNGCTDKTPFVFFAAFDGTNNDEENFLFITGKPPALPGRQSKFDL